MTAYDSCAAQDPTRRRIGSGPCNRIGFGCKVPGRLFANRLNVGATICKSNELKQEWRIEGRTEGFESAARLHLDRFICGRGRSRRPMYNAPAPKNGATKKRCAALSSKATRPMSALCPTSSETSPRAGPRHQKRVTVSPD